ncbi:MAG: HEXXH motif-containing putative peptide modification protein [Bacteriovorax sp.]|nr:HEXXH motif-containing putative peptide modification protein [Bacteriovorax sp.]
MKEQLFSKDFHNKLKKNVEKSYRDFIEDLREDFKRGFSTDVVDTEFLDQLSDILQDECFDNYSPLKFYWLNLVDNIVYIIQLHEELLHEDDMDTNELTEVENELFNFWNDSELAESFLNFLNDGSPVIEASTNLLALLENQIISFYVLHLNLYQQEFDDALMYQTIPELGDSERKFYISDAHKRVILKKTPDTFPSLPLRFISPEKKLLSIEIANKAISFPIESPPAPIPVDELSLYVLPNSEAGEKRVDEFKKNISKALANIKKAAPHLYITFKSFTHTIVPVDEKGIVSYSMQSLPGYSSINMFDRDQLDLMDDLLHENGHHFLNTFLNYQDLINEDDDKIYFSPWRKALRPIRGIYHATFTFFWALELYYHLNIAADKKTLNFTKEEKTKIKFRFLEEYFMLDFCRTDLQHAYKNKRINKEGNQLITMIYERISAYKKDTSIVLESLKALDAKKYQELMEIKDELVKTRSHYKLV